MDDSEKRKAQEKVRTLENEIRTLEDQVSRFKRERDEIDGKLRNATSELDRKKRDLESARRKARGGY
jgi:chromosome segregation ATPase